MKKSLAVFVSVLFMVLIVLSGCGSKGGQSVETGEGESNGSGNNTGETDFPTQDITFLIPNGPGGANDLAVRGLIPVMENDLGVNVIPENKPASNGVVAAVEMENSDSDGYTLYFNSQTLILLSFQGNEIDLTNYQPLAQIVEDTSAITVSADAPYDTLEDLVKYAQQNPGKLKIATNGNGALWHLSAATFANAADLDLQYVPYSSGGAEMSKALAAGEVDISANSPSEVKALVEAGKLKVLAVQSNERHPLFPDVPTAREQGIDSEFPVWRGIFTKKGTDEATLQVLEDSIKKAWESDEFKTFLENNGMPGKFRGYEDFTEFFERQIEFYDKLLNE